MIEVFFPSSWDQQKVEDWIGDFTAYRQHPWHYSEEQYAASFYVENL